MKKIITMTLLALSAGSFLQAQEVPVLDEGIRAQQIIEEVDFDLYLEDEILFEPEYEVFDDYREPMSNNKLNLKALKNGRALSEINTENSVDAYPWLSTDGLRLYFTQHVDGRDAIVMAERANLKAEFNAPVALSLISTDHNTMSCFLTEDELTIYFTVSEDGYKLYKAIRQNRKAEFGEAMEIELDSEDLGFISAPSLTPDGEQLFFYQSNDGTRIIQFQRVAENHYELIGALEFPEDVNTVTPGQISRDGLTYYGLSHSSDDIIVLKRPELKAAFKFDSRVEVGNDFHQLSIGQEWMVFCHSPNNSWGTNDLYIAESPFKNSIAVNTLTECPVAIENITLTVVNMELFPNPGETFVNIRFDLPDLKGEALLEIFDATGKVLKSENVMGNGTQTLQVDVSDMPSGSYFCRLIGHGFEAAVKTLIVK